MGLININLTNPRHVRVSDAICEIYGYEAVDDNGVPNPETRDVFTERMLKEFILNIVKSHEQKKAQQNFIKQNPIADLTID